MSDLFSNIFGRKKHKNNDTSLSSEKPNVTIKPEESNPESGAEKKSDGDYEQLYSFVEQDWTLINRPTGEQQASKTTNQVQGSQERTHYLSGVPFRVAGVASERQKLRDLDLVILQFSSKLGDVQTLTSADYDFALENQVMNEAITAAESTQSNTLQNEETEEQQMAKLMQFANM